MIRAAAAGDASAIAEIYAHHVAHGTASFDYDAPDAAYWTAKIDEFLRRKWPFLVTEDGGEVLAYAYASQIRGRPGYRHTGEDSIYVRADRQGKGIGKSLLTAIIEAAPTSGFKQMVAVIGGDEPASVALHTRLGFREVGRIHNAGFKFGLWLDTVYMQRAVDEP